MLPFLNQRKQEGSASQHIASDGSTTSQESEDTGLMSAAQDLVNAIHAKDHKSVIQALRNCMAMMGE